MPYDPQPYEAINNAVFGDQPQDQPATISTPGSLDYLNPQSQDISLQNQDLANPQNNPFLQDYQRLEEKRKRLELAAEQKRMKIYGKAPVEYESDGVTPINDSETTLYAKQIVNKALSAADWVLEATQNIANFGQGHWLDNARFNAEINGRNVDMRNKDFIGASGETLDSLRQQYQEAENNPNALGGVYTFRKQVGIDANGNPQYVYKNGFASGGAWNRYKNQYITDDGWELVGEKRFAGASDLERKLNAIAALKGLNTFDSGKVNINGERLGRDEAVFGTPFGSGVSEILNKDVLGVDNGITPEQAVLNLARSKVFGKYYNKHNKGSLNPIRAIGSGAISTAASVGDFILDALTPGGNNTLLDKYKEPEWADSVTGYNRFKANQYLAEATDLVKKGDYFHSLAPGIVAGTDTFAESVPMMALMMAPIPGARVAGGLSKAAEVARVVEAAKAAGRLGELGRVTDSFVLNTAKKVAAESGNIDEAQKIYETYKNAKGSLAKLNTMAHLAKNGGFYTNWAAYTNNQLDQLAQNKAKAGDNSGIDYSDIIRVAAIELPALALDKIAFKDIVLGRGIGSEIIKEALKTPDKVVKNAVARKLLGVGANVAKTMGEEGIQEFTQEWGDILSENLGVPKRDLKTILTDPEMLDRAITAGIGGAFAGPVGHVVGAAPRALSAGWDKATGKDMLNKSFRSASSASSVVDLGSDDIYPHDAEAVVASHLREPGPDGASWRLGDFSIDNPESFNKTLDTLTQKRAKILENAGEEEKLGYNEIKKSVVGNILNTAFNSAVDVSKQTGDTSPIENFSRNVAKLISNPNINVTAQDVADSFANDAVSDVASLFGDIAKYTKTETSESGEPSISMDKEALDHHIDKIINKINLYGGTLAKIQGSTINVGGEDLEVDDSILGAPGSLTLAKLKDVLEKYRQGGKTLDDVANEVADLGYIEERGARPSEGIETGFIKWKPSIKHFAIDLKNTFADPTRLKHVLNPKVQSGKRTSLGGFSAFAKSRLEKLIPYTTKQGYVVDKVIAPLLMSKVEQENAQMKQLASSLQAMLSVAKTDKRFTEEDKIKIREKLDEIQSDIDASNAKLNEYRNALIPYIEQTLGIKFKVDNPLSVEAIRKNLAGHMIHTTLDENGNIVFEPVTNFSKSKYSTEQNLEYQRNSLIKGGFAEPAGSIVNTENTNKAPSVSKNVEPVGSSANNQKLNGLQKQLDAINKTINDIEKSQKEIPDALLKKKQSIEKEIASLQKQSNKQAEESKNDNAEIDNNKAYDEELSKLIELQKRVEDGSLKYIDYTIESLHELRRLLEKYNDSGVPSAVQAVAGNIRSYALKVESAIEKQKQELENVQRERHITGLKKLSKFIKDAWNKIRKGVRKLLAYKVGLEDVAANLSTLTTKTIDEQISAIDELINTAENLKKDITTLSKYVNLGKKHKLLTESAKKAIEIYKKLLAKNRRKIKKKDKTRNKAQSNTKQEEPADKEPSTGNSNTEQDNQQPNTENEEYNWPDEEQINNEISSQEEYQNQEQTVEPNVGTKQYNEDTIRDMDVKQELEPDPSMSNDELEKLTDKILDQIMTSIDEFNEGCE